MLYIKIWYFTYCYFYGIFYFVILSLTLSAERDYGDIPQRDDFRVPQHDAGREVRH